MNVSKAKTTFMDALACRRGDARFVTSRVFLKEAAGLLLTELDYGCRLRK